MQVSVETLSGLKRKLTISVPAAKVEEEVGLRLDKLAGRVKIDGFRPGKVPRKLVDSRFSDSVREEVARDMVQSSLYEALQEQNLLPAGSPYVEPEEIAPNKDFTFTAEFEVFPEIKIIELDGTKIELVESSVTKSDVDTMLEKLREQNKQWTTVSRAAADGDKVVIDFEGFFGDEPFEGGKAQNHELIIGSNAMIPGFETAIIGHTTGKPFDITVTFPDDYQHKDFAGKEARFTILIHEIKEGTLPPLDDEFAVQFNIKEGGIDALRKDITQNMERELERRISSLNRERIFEKLMEINVFDLPVALIDREIEHLKHDMYHRLFGNHHTENEKIPDFPRELFEEQAKRRVHLGLLFSEYVKLHEMAADDSKVDAMIEKLADAYESPDELRQWYRSDKERLAEVEALVMEEMVADKIAENAKITRKKTKYEEVMNPSQDKKNEGKEA